MTNPRPAFCPPFTLGLVLFPGCMPAGLFAVSDWVRACNLRARQTRVAVRWVAAELKPVPTHRGPALVPEALLSDPALDACLLPGLWLIAADEMAPALEALRPTVAALAALPRTTQVWSYCAGVALRPPPAGSTGRPPPRPGGCNLHWPATTRAWPGATQPTWPAASTMPRPSARTATCR